MTIPRNDLIAAVLVAVLALLAAVMLAGCGDIRPEVKIPEQPATLAEKVEKLTSEKTKATAERDAAIKTSADAHRAAQEARAEASAARELADKKDGEAKSYEKQAADLRRAEIAIRISWISWIIAGVGLLAAFIGGFLLLRFPGKTALAVALSGVGTLGLGLVGIWLAPHWIAAVWGIAIAIIIGLVAGLAYLLHDHQRALRQVWDGAEGDIMKDPRLAKLLRKSGAKI